MKTLLLASLLTSLLFVPAVIFLPVAALAEHQQFTPCCKDGSSPWASESQDTFKSNARAGYQGSELPPSTGYNPDHLDKYENPALNNIYQREAPETPPKNSEIQPQRYGGEPVQGIARP